MDVIRVGRNNEHQINVRLISKEWILDLGSITWYGQDNKYCCQNKRVRNHRVGSKTLQFHLLT